MVSCELGVVVRLITYQKAPIPDLRQADTGAMMWRSVTSRSEFLLDGSRRTSWSDKEPQQQADYRQDQDDQGPDDFAAY